MDDYSRFEGRGSMTPNEVRRLDVGRKLVWTVLAAKLFESFCGKTVEFSRYADPGDTDIPRSIVVKTVQGEKTFSSSYFNYK